VKEITEKAGFNAQYKAEGDAVFIFGSNGGLAKTISKGEKRR